MDFDRDLVSVQEVRNLIAASKAAQEEYASWDQQRVDMLVKAITEECEKNSERLAKLAVEETGFGIWQDKVLKNALGSTLTYDYIKDMKTIGIIGEDEEKGIMEVGVPMGIVAALIPSTNPTSTVMYKTLICLKAGNSIIISPHPNAFNSILETVKVIHKALERCNAPKALVQCITTPTSQGRDTLLRDRRIGIILATGGEAMVRAAYSSGNPALGVGPGNGPSFIERSADIPLAVKRIFDSKTFDNGTICASEQSIITEKCIADDVIQEVKRQGGYFLSPAESEKVGRFILRENGTMNPKIVGRSARKIAEMAGITIPEGTRVLLSVQTTVGKDNPYSREKLCPILAFYVEENWEKACERSIQILNNEGVGHTMTMHTRNKDVVRQFALKKPVSRLLVNTPGSLGGTGASTALPPALTLGCGAVGGSATSDNVTPLNLINIRRVAYGLKELSEIQEGYPAPDGCGGSPCPSRTSGTDSGVSREEIEAITKAVIARLKSQQII